MAKVRICIKVSREVSKWVKTLSDDVREYLGEALNYKVSTNETDWDEVSKVSVDCVRFWLYDYAGADTEEELENKASRFCYSYGFYGYRLQSRF